MFTKQFSLLGSSLIGTLVRVATTPVYLILNLYEQSLEEYVKENSEQITESHVQEMMCQVLQGLEVLHGRKPKILHRDLKPSNILIDVNGKLALSDFGIARILSVEGRYNVQGQIIHVSRDLWC